MKQIRIEIRRCDDNYWVWLNDAASRYDTVQEAVIAVQHALMLNLSHENEQRTKDKRE